MSLLQRAIETYDFMNQNKSVGVYDLGKEPLAPISHIIAKGQISITIDEKGSFITASKCDEKIIIPVSEESAGRSSGIRAHALCDQMQYITNIYPEKNSMYIEQLEEWCNSGYSYSKIEAVLKYVKVGTAINDLDNSGLLQRDGKGNIANIKDMICWIVLGLGDDSGPVWKDIKLFNKYSDYYVNEICGNAKQEICYISGNRESVAKQHLKGAVPKFGNAKLISANDNTNFTYRGRFFEPDDAMGVGYISSQKAHNALKWIIANQGVLIGEKTFVCWTPHGIEVPAINLPFGFKDDEETFEMSEYSSKLRQFLYAYEPLRGVDEKAVIAIFEAATSGRLSLLYYKEIMGVYYLDRLSEWYETCCWITYTGNIASPSLNKITILSHGNQRGNDENAKMDIDPRIEGQLLQRLIICRLDKTSFPRDIMMCLVNKSNNMQTYNKNNRRDILFTTCAVIRKYWKDHYNKEVRMVLDENFKDRSYQFGRLLAVLEKIERDTYDTNEKREPNAIRLQSVFVKRPDYAFKMIMEQLKNAYYPKLNQGSRVMYEKLIGQIMEEIALHPMSEYGKPLNELYLVGYYLQKNHMYKKHTKDKNEENKEME